MRKLSVDYQIVAKELFKVLRGCEPQMKVNKHFGVSFNLCYRFESGLKEIFWEDFIRLCDLKDISLKNAFIRLTIQSVEFKVGVDVLTFLKHDQNVTEFASSLKISRVRMSRMLSGRSKVPLRIILEAIQIKTKNLLNFLYELCDIEKLPVLKSFVRNHKLEQALVKSHPHTLIVLQVLEFESYIKLKKHSSQLIADLLSINVQEVDYIVQQMVKLRRIKKKNGIYTIEPTYFNRLKESFEEYRDIRVFWLERVLKKMNHQLIDVNSKAEHLLVSVSQEQFLRIMEIYTQFYQKLNLIINTPVQDAPIMSKSLTFSITHIAGENKMV